MSPTQRSLKRLRDAGWLAEVVEKNIPRVNIKKDLFGCIDILAIRENTAPLGIQATTRSNRASRVKKAASLQSTYVWLQSGNCFQVWGWGKTKEGWSPGIVDFWVVDGKVMYGQVPNET